MPDRPRHPVVLVILDGWGYREAREANAVALAGAPRWRALFDAGPSTLLTASGEEVGLPAGQMGNSEVGHLNIGAGRIVAQDLVRISAAIRDGSLAAHPVLQAACDRARVRGSTLHLMGLIGDGGVHAHDEHLIALLRIAHAAGVPRIALHLLLDGRDTAPRSGRQYLEQLLPVIAECGAQIASIGGRYFGMDRDQRWERTARWYDAAVLGTAPAARDAGTVIDEAYAGAITDEFVPPCTMVDAAGHAIAPFRDGDELITWNFRSDRMRQIVRRLVAPAVAPDDAAPRLAISVTTMTSYDATLPVQVIFPPQNMRLVLGDVLAAHGLAQYRTAETEKYPHVTYYFNGGVEPPARGEDRVMVPSPKVATYDLQPEMSAAEVTDRLVDAILSGHYDFVLVNFANPDMVGHTGSLPAAIAAVQAVDHCLGRVLDAAAAHGAYVCVTADHGNCEVMVDPVTGEPHTAHTTNPVPFSIANAPAGTQLRAGGILADIAPTVLSLLEVPIPPDMTGRDLRLPPLS
jgi:2,3-bisphosphoglycerate-independent phosphoglycerate mutase